MIFYFQHYKLYTHYISAPTVQHFIAVLNYYFSLIILLVAFCPPIWVPSSSSQVGLRHKINDNLMIYPGYVPREGIEPILLHYGLPFSVGNWSFNKLAHHDDGIVYECNQLFPEPPYPKEVCKQLYLFKETSGIKEQVFSPHGVLVLWENKFLCYRKACVLH